MLDHPLYIILFLDVLELCNQPLQNSISRAWMPRHFQIPLVCALAYLHSWKKQGLERTKNEGRLVCWMIVTGSNGMVKKLRSSWQGTTTKAPTPNAWYMRNGRHGLSKMPCRVHGYSKYAELPVSLVWHNKSQMSQQHAAETCISSLMLSYTHLWKEIGFPPSHTSKSICCRKRCECFIFQFVPETPMEKVHLQGPWKIM